MRDWGSVPHKDTRDFSHCDFGGQCDLQARSIKTCFLLGEVNVTVSWWSSGYDARPECERLGFDSLLRHKKFNPL